LRKQFRTFTVGFYGLNVQLRYLIDFSRGGEAVKLLNGVNSSTNINFTIESTDVIDLLLDQ
jgi:hypothetical protein